MFVAHFKEYAHRCSDHGHAGAGYHHDAYFRVEAETRSDAEAKSRRYVKVERIASCQTYTLTNFVSLISEPSWAGDWPLTFEQSGYILPEG